MEQGREVKEEEARAKKDEEGSMEEIENPDRDKNFEAKGDSCGLLEREGLTSMEEGSLPPLQEPAEELKAEERPNPPSRDDSTKECDRTDHRRKEQGTSELMLQMRKIIKKAEL